MTELEKKRALAIHNIDASFVKEGRNPRLLLAFWPDAPFDQAFEDMVQDPRLTEDDRRALRNVWGTLVEIDERSKKEPLFGVVIVFFENESTPGIVPVPAAAEALIRLP